MKHAGVPYRPDHAVPRIARIAHDPGWHPENPHATVSDTVQEVQFFHLNMSDIHSDLRRLDLNLLVVFDALYRQRSVTAAAAGLAMSPSAVSHALARLRETLGDELFVRFGNEMQPTVRAEAMADWVADALGLCLRGLREARRFDPAHSERTFVFAATDYTTFAVLPPLVATIERIAPRMRLRIVQSERKIVAEDLAAGRLDFALGYHEDGAPPVPGIEELDWFSDDYVVIASARHPALGSTLSLEAYLAARHVVVTPWNEARGAIDLVLDSLGLAREVAVQLPSVLAAPFLIADSALLMTIPRRAALALAPAAPIRIFPVPFAIPRYTVKLYSHAKHARTDAHRWLREQLLATAPA